MVINKHALRNALIPFITVLVLTIPGPLCGRDLDRDSLCLAGDGAPVQRCAAARRLQCRPGLHLHHDHPDGVCHAAGRHFVRRGRSTHPLFVSFA